VKTTKQLLFTITLTTLVYFFSISSYAADLCFCPAKPIGTECKNKCKGNPGGVVVFLPNKPEQPDTSPFENRALWSKQLLEEFRNNSEQYRILLEFTRQGAESKRRQLGQYPPTLEYKRGMTDYFKGIESYKYNMYQYKNLQKLAK
jgi:hypothetical protein